MPEWILMNITFAVLVGVFIAFIREKTPPHIIALTGMVVLLAVGAISTEDMLSVFGNSAPVTIACMFVISAALDQTGVIDSLGRFLLRISLYNKYLGLCAMMGVVVSVSPFMNNTPLVVILTPVVITLALKLNDFPSRYLIPLSYISILGGMCTLIGTSTNILVNGVAQKYGQPAFSMFEITGLGLTVMVAGILFMVIFGHYLLPKITPKKSTTSSDKAEKRFVAEAIITTDSFLIGKTINEIKFTESETYEIIDLVRLDRGSRFEFGEALSGFLQNFIKDKEKPKTEQVSTFRDIPLQAGDKIVFKLEKEEIIELQSFVGIEFDPEKAHLGETFASRPVIAVEGIIPGSSNFIGKRIKDLRLRRAYGCFVVGIFRHDENITGNLAQVVLQEGDSLIIEGPEEELARMFDNEQIMSASYVRGMKLNRFKAPIAILTLLSVVTLSAFEVMPIAGLSMVGALAVILCGCVTTDKAYRTIDWGILLLIFGMLGIGTALENTGGIELFITYVVSFVKDMPPIYALAIIYILTLILTELASNNAVAIILTPIAIGLATTLGYDPRPFIVAVMFASTVAFATPVGYQTNTFVYLAGGYRFMDFVRIGLPLNIVTATVAIYAIPYFWPF